MLPKAERLTTEDIKALAQGKSVFGTLVSLRFVPADKTKFAVAVSKKVAARAVDRNRIRRRVYAIVKNTKATFNKAFFVMLSPKKECLTAPKEAIGEDITRLFNKALK